MKKNIFILLIVFLVVTVFSCSIDVNKPYKTAGYIISFDKNETVTFYGLEKSWKNSSTFYIPSNLYGRNVTKIAYKASATWDGCSVIFIPSTVNVIEKNVFDIKSSTLTKIYWDKSGVTQDNADFVPRGVVLYAKSDGKYVNVVSGETDEKESNTDTSNTYNREIQLTYIDVLTEPAKKTYAIDEKFESQGMKVKAYYSDSSNKDVTDRVIISGFDSSRETSSQRITVKYSENGITKSDYFYISIKDKGEEIGRILIYDFSNYQSGDIGRYLNNSAYSNGVLTVYPYENGKVIDTIYFKGAGSSVVINGLCIKIPNEWISKPKIIFENISFASSKSQPLIDSAVDILIEYRGYNQLTSSAKDKISLIHAYVSNIELKAADNNSKFILKTNTVKNSTEGSIGIESDKVIINGGIFAIEGSNGLNFDVNDTSGKTGREGASGIKASETIIKNNATVSITAGNGGNGSQGVKGDPGDPGWDRNNFFTFENAGKGKDGKNGKPGGAGGPGGIAIKGNLFVESGNVTLFGGKGGTGGKGGEGGNGGKGGDNYAVNYAPGNGGKAGDGGQGGPGGNGGDAVSGSVRGNVRLKPGIGGTGGVGGDPGTRGQRGYAKIDEDEGWRGDGTANDGGSGDKGFPGTPGEDGVQHR